MKTKISNHVVDAKLMQANKSSKTTKKYTSINIGFLFFAGVFNNVSANPVESGVFEWQGENYNYSVVLGDIRTPTFLSTLKAAVPYAVSPTTGITHPFVEAFFRQYTPQPFWNTTDVRFPKSAYVYGRTNEWEFVASSGLANWAPNYLNLLSFTPGDSNYWLIFSSIVLGPSAEDTLNSFRPNAFALRNTFNLQSANITHSLSYDCTVFDAKNICASFSGTRSDQSGYNLDSTTGTLVIAHRPAANVRFGGYINQSLNTSEQGGLRLERSKPGMGAFVNYAMTSGLNIRGSVGFGKRDMQTTRELIESAEAGVGKSNITTQGAQLELSEAFDIKAGWTAVPYAGIRKVTNKRAAYSEIESEAVSAPLTYADLKQTQTTAFGGIRFNGQVAPQLQLLVSAGFESDRTNKVDDYIATGVDGLGSISMQENVKKTRPVFATSLSYDIAKNERASIAVLHRQEAFDSKKTTSVGFTYTKGF